MRILVDARSLTIPNLSGIPLYAKSLLEHISRIDNKNSYTLFTNAFRRMRSVLSEISVDKTNFSEFNWRIPNHFLDYSFFFLNFPHVDFKRSPDIIFRPHFQILGAEKSIPNIVTFHDLSFVKHSKFFPNRKNLWHFFQKPKYQAENAAHIIAVSRATKRDLVEFYKIPPEKISVIYSGIHDFYLNDTHEDIPLRVLKIDFPFVLFVGTLEPRKNISGLIKAFSILKQNPNFKGLRLVIVGSRGWLWKDILKTAENSPFKDQIIFWGRGSDLEIKELYKKAEVFVYPSFFEGFGFPPLEAQACGTPVVSSRDGALLEALSDSAFLTDAERPESIAGGMSKILSDKSLKESLIAKGYTNIKRFSWDKCARETLEVFSKFGERIE